MFVPVVTLLAEDNEAKGVKNQCIGINIKQKARTETLQMSIDIFSYQTL